MQNLSSSSHHSTHSSQKDLALTHYCRKGCIWIDFVDL